MKRGMSKDNDFHATCQGVTIYNFHIYPHTPHIQCLYNASQFVIRDFIRWGAPDSRMCIIKRRVAHSRKLLAYRGLGGVGMGGAVSYYPPTIYG